jgi:hypothetical protein
MARVFILIATWMALAPASFAQVPPDPIIFTVPPEELQTGGNEFFSGLKSEADFPIERREHNSFLNQEINLELLGPGTNVTIVTDKSMRYFAFGITNGRFESIGELGRMDDFTYPNSLPEQTGKYPWPRDNRGHYLPAYRLHQSNGPHGKLESLIDQIHGQKDLEYIAGHVGINTEGQAYIGYVSGSVNYMHNRRQDNGLEDERALPAHLRAVFHAALRRYVHGRGIETVLQRAPETVEKIKASHAVQHFPDKSLIPANDYWERATPAGVLANRFTEKEYLEYISKIPGDTAMALLASFMSDEGTNARRMHPSVFEHLQGMVKHSLKSDAKTLNSAVQIWIDHPHARVWLNDKLLPDLRASRIPLSIEATELHKLFHVLGYRSLNAEQTKVVSMILVKANADAFIQALRWRFFYQVSDVLKREIHGILSQRSDAEFVVTKTFLTLATLPGQLEILRELTVYLSPEGLNQTIADLKNRGRYEPSKDQLINILEEARPADCAHLLTGSN